MITIRSRALAAFLCVLGASLPALAAEPSLRVCADPNNLPFSNQKEQGFENELARLIARQLRLPLAYTWWPERRGFLRKTLKAKRCDVVMGLPAGFEGVLSSEPVYRSSYVFVSRLDRAPVTSLAAPELARSRIGVPIVGDDGANPPPIAALLRHHLIDNLRGYSVYGDYRQESPPSALIHAVRAGEVDLAIAWGPLAGYYAQNASPRLRVTPVPESEAAPGQPLSFEITLAVRKGDAALLERLNRALAKRRAEVRALLRKYHFPLL